VTLGVDALEALRARRIDFAWIFDGWQGIQAKREGLELTTFALSEYGVPDYSTPNIIISPETLEKKKEILRKFMKATARGYEYARLHPRESAEMLIAIVPPGTFPDTEFVFESQEYLSPLYADLKVPWGFQSESAWRDYPSFMLEKRSVFDAAGQVVTELNVGALYTNELLP
jgi:ABC-type nitrate/sulfonate/bicarbonate transport system substrate-binding protein